MKNILNKLFSITTMRLLLGFIFLWAFVDKLFGFGIATSPEKSWLAGGSPTAGFLANAVQGPFTNFFHSLSGVPVIDWLFMGGLIFAGLTLLTNKFVKWGALTGMMMLGLMYLALLWPSNNPFVDEHLVYIIVLGYITLRRNDSV